MRVRKVDTKANDCSYGRKCPWGAGYRRCVLNRFSNRMVRDGCCRMVRDGGAWSYFECVVEVDGECGDRRANFIDGKDIVVCHMQLEKAAVGN